MYNDPNASTPHTEITDAWAREQAQRGKGADATTYIANIIVISADAWAEAGIGTQTQTQTGQCAGQSDQEKASA